MRKITGSYEDYSRDNILWSEAFLNYTMILIELFNATTFSLYLVLYFFYREIIDLSMVYKW